MKNFSLRKKINQSSYIIAGLLMSFGAVQMTYASDGFVQTIGGANNDRAKSVVQSDDGGYVVAGETETYGSFGDFYVAKFDNTGNLDTNFGSGGTRVVGSGVSGDVGRSLIRTADGGYAIAGHNYYGLYVVKLTSTGALDTSFGSGGSRAVGKAAGNKTDGYSIVQTADGGYALSGATSNYGAGQWDFYIVKLTSTGALDTNFGSGGYRTIGLYNQEFAYTMIQSSDGGYVIAGSTDSTTFGANDIYIVKLTSTGAFDTTFGTTGVQRIGGTGNDIAYSIIQTSDGGYAIAGGADNFGAGGSDMYIVKLTSLGAFDTTFGNGGTRTIGGASADAAHSIVQTSDGGYIIAGETYTYGAGEYDMYIAKITGNGSLDTSFGTGGTLVVGGSSTDKAYSIIQTADSGYAIAGETNSFGAGLYDMYLVKIDGTGDMLSCSHKSGFGGTVGSGGAITSGSGQLGSGGVVSSESRVITSGGNLAQQCSIVIVHTSEVITQQSTNITPLSVTANSEIISVGTDNPTRSVEYGTTSGSYTGSCSAGVGGAGSYSCQLAGLTPDTTYYYRAIATNSAGTSYGEELSFATLDLPSEVTITNPDPTKMNQALSNSYTTLSSGTIDATPEVTINTNLKIEDTIFDITFPQATQITNTDSGNFNFQNFIAQNVSTTVKQALPNSIAAIKVGVPNTKLTFSQSATLSIDVNPAYNGRTLDVFYQNDGESTWHSQTSCTIQAGKCIFQTNHATTYSVNGSGDMVGETGINLNTDIQEVITLNCGSTTINLQNITPGSPVTGSSTCTATTNANGGYSLSVRRDDATSTLKKTSENSTIIPDKTPWDPTANTNTGNADTWSGTGLGFTVYDSNATKNSSWWGTGTTLTDTNNKYAGFSPTQTDIMIHSDYAETPTNTSIGYKLDVPPTQKSGAYSGNITYQVVTRP